VSGATLDALRAAWERSDRLFGWLRPEAIWAQPIPLRQPFIFYLGHLPAFAWNHLGRRRLGKDAFRPELDLLFERGIDPVGVDAYVAADRSCWPRPGDVVGYRDRVRDALGAAERAGELEAPGARDDLAMVLEHELMHHETLLYMVQELDSALKDGPEEDESGDEGGGVAPDVAEVPGGRVVLGAARGSLAFGWDNEFPEHALDVPDFAIDTTPVRNRDFLEFVGDGGYGDPRLWTEEDWAWRARCDVRFPRFWVCREGGFRYRGVFGERPFEEAHDWPVYVSWAEAAAFARWRGARLPTEAEFHRAAFGREVGPPSAHPWGEAAPAVHHGNFGFRRLAPEPVGSRPGGASAWGVHELVGNGWEWTSTAFAPLPGFAPMPHYPGYSADFFDGRHYVLLGASLATDDRLVRRSFRNWFQAHYPYPFAKFRCVSERG
jgi:ergothioneine biosynthesis protein EgtB